LRRAAIEDWKVTNDLLRAELENCRKTIAKNESELKKQESVLASERKAANDTSRTLSEIKSRYSVVEDEISEWRRKKESTDKLYLEEKRAHELSDKRLVLRGSQLVEIQKSLTQTESKLTDTEKKLSVMTERYETTNTALINKESELTQLVSVIKEVNINLDRSRTECSRLEYEIEELRRVHSQCSNFAAQLMEAKKRIDHLQDDNTTKDKALSKINDDWNVKLADHTHCSEDKLQLTNRIASLTTRLTHVESQNAKLTIDLNTIDQLHAPCPKIIQSQKDEIEAGRVRYDTIEAERQRLDSELGVMTTKSQTAEQQLKFHKIVITQIDNEKKRYEKELSDKVAMLDATLERNRALEEENREHKIRVTELKEDLGKLKSDNKTTFDRDVQGLYQLRVKYAEMEEECSNAKRSLSNSEKLVASLQSEVTSLQSVTIQQMITDRDTLRNKLDSAVRAQKEEGERSQSTIDKLNSDLKTANEQLKDVTTQLSSLRSEYDRLSSLHSTCRKQNDSNEAQIVGLKDRIQRLENELKNAASLTAGGSNNAAASSSTSPPQPPINATVLVSPKAVVSVGPTMEEWLRLQKQHSSLVSTHNACQSVKVDLEHRLDKAKSSLTTFEKLAVSVPALHAEKQRLTDLLEDEKRSHESTAHQLSDLQSEHQKCSSLSLANDTLNRELKLTKSALQSSNELTSKLTAVSTTKGTDTTMEALRVANSEIARLTSETLKLNQSSHLTSEAMELLQSKYNSLNDRYSGIVKEQKRKTDIVTEAKNKLRSIKPQIGIVCANTPQDGTPFIQLRDCAVTHSHCVVM